MSSVLLIRFLSAIAIAGFLIAAYWVINAVILVRTRGKRLGLETLQVGIPAVLYFTTPSCVPCKTVQRPALAQLQKTLGDKVQVIEIDASAQPHLADYWGVLSVPTTFIIDKQGRPRRVNHGVAGAEKLQKQLEEVDQKVYFSRYLQTILHKMQSMRNYL